jgi:hypothetical protein
MKKLVLLAVLCCTPLFLASAQPSGADMAADAGLKQADAVIEGAQKEIKGALERVEKAGKAADAKKAVTTEQVKEQAADQVRAAAEAEAVEAAAHAGHTH